MYLNSDFLPVGNFNQIWNSTIYLKLIVRAAKSFTVCSISRIISESRIVLKFSWLLLSYTNSLFNTTQTVILRQLHILFIASSSIRASSSNPPRSHSSISHNLRRICIFSGGWILRSKIRLNTFFYNKKNLFKKWIYNFHRY